MLDEVKQLHFLLSTTTPLLYITANMYENHVCDIVSRAYNIVFLCKEIQLFLVFIYVFFTDG